jgi:hypothetical protein
MGGAGSPPAPALLAPNHFIVSAPPGLALRARTGQGEISTAVAAMGARG